jgi:hypothetical protein
VTQFTRIVAAKIQHLSFAFREKTNRRKKGAASAIAQ